MVKGGKRAKAPKRYRKRRVPRSLGTKNYARVVEDLPGEMAITTNTSYVLKNFALAPAARAVAVAQGYQFYRIAKVELFVKPLQDTYIADTVAPGTGQGIPYFYYKIDRLNSVPAVFNLGTLKRMGVKPIRIDDNTIKIAWKPNVIIGATDSSVTGALTAELSAMSKVSPWLTTNANAGQGTAGTQWTASSVDHYGLVFGVDCPRQTANYVCAAMQVRLTFEFKDPLWINPTTQGPALPAAVQVNLNNLTGGEFHNPLV